MRPPHLPATPYDYTVTLPEHLLELHNYSTQPDENSITNHGATLGRVLFHDRALSKNFLVSCASCHSQELGFDDRNQFSIGLTGKITKRHSVGLAFAGFNSNGRYFRDEHAPTLETQVLEPIHDPIEMGLMKGELSTRVKVRGWYVPLFEKAFGSSEITDREIAKALAQFVRSMISINSPYDKARADAQDRVEPFPQLSDAENQGKKLFMKTRNNGGFGCAECHETEAFIMLDRHNNGLNTVDDTSMENALMRGASLRNISVRGPYMHDGRFGTLEEVLDHYSIGINAHPDLGSPLKTEDGMPVQLNITSHQKRDLLAFLDLLTDETFLNDPKFSNPFKAASR